jgi:hypothetical protein
MARTPWLLLFLLGSCGERPVLGAECQGYTEEVRRFCAENRERPGTREACAELEALPERWQAEVALARSQEEVLAMEARCKESRAQISALNRADAR